MKNLKQKLFVLSTMIISCTISVIAQTVTAPSAAEFQTTTKDWFKVGMFIAASAVTLVMIIGTARTIFTVQKNHGEGSESIIWWVVGLVIFGIASAYFGIASFANQ